jgi:hypothetical protein
MFIWRQPKKFSDSELFAIEARRKQPTYTRLGYCRFPGAPKWQWQLAIAGTPEYWMNVQSQ